MDAKDREFLSRSKCSYQFRHNFLCLSLHDPISSANRATCRFLRKINCSGVSSQPGRSRNIAPSNFLCNRLSSVSAFLEGGQRTQRYSHTGWEERRKSPNFCFMLKWLANFEPAFLKKLAHTRRCVCRQQGHMHESCAMMCPKQMKFSTGRHGAERPELTPPLHTIYSLLSCLMVNPQQDFKSSSISTSCWTASAALLLKA